MTRIVLAALALAACGADRAVVPEPLGYDDPAAWLCLPGGEGQAGGADACAAADLSVDVVSPDGTVATEPFVAADNPAADCFYVYPTTSRDRTFNADMVPDQSEISTVTAQFARFAESCRLFAPMYRQQSIAGLRDVFLGGEGGDDDVPHEDVGRAFRHYLETWNEGRPFVLYGHSQGTRMLMRLIEEELGDGPARDRLLGAYLLGINVFVPTEGSSAEADLPGLPECEAPSDTGCLVAFATFLAGDPPPEDSLFGRSQKPGLRPSCVDPSALFGREALGAVLPSGGFGENTRQGADWTRAEGEAVTAPFVALPGLIKGRCVEDEALGYLEISLTGGEGDPRTGDLGGEIVVLGRRQRNWGLHIADGAVAQDDLIELVRTQSEAFARAAAD